METAKTAIFTMGGAGSGKSYVMRNQFPGVRVIDCDQFKKEIPGYDPKQPQLVHEESSRRAKKEFARTIAMDSETFIYDGTGANAEGLVSRIKQAQELGWNTLVVYVACSLKTAINRNAKRERSVSETLLREQHALIPVSFEIVSRYADEVRVINND